MSPIKDPESPTKLQKEKSFKSVNLMAKEGTLITKDESDEIIRVNWGVYFDYLKSGHIWIPIFLIAAPLTGVGCWCWLEM